VGQTVRILATLPEDKILPAAKKRDCNLLKSLASAKPQTQHYRSHVANPLAYKVSDQKEEAQQS
jgi:hypothetical protein